MYDSRSSEFMLTFGGAVVKRILLVSPNRGSDFANPQRTGQTQRVESPLALLPPLDLATISALTPSDYEVRIWDEAVHGEIDDSTDLGGDWDVGGVTGYQTHIVRMNRIGRVLKKRGMMTIVGGPGVSGAPERCRGQFDVVFIGEAEYTWPRFLDDWRRGESLPEYRQVQRPDINDSPIPRWDGFENMARDYLMGPVQTTRGCPFDCEFCDVIHLFGRNPRHKSIDTLLQEVTNLNKLGVRKIFFCDDNFIGEPRYAREFLKALIPVNNSFDRPIGFVTQLTLNLARDDELLELMADANFGPVQVGVESPRQESLREANKPQNYKHNVADDVRKIQSYGIPIKANMIVGFDHDDRDIFRETFDFLQDVYTPNASLSILKAFPGTPLLARMLKDGRVINNVEDHDTGHAMAGTNLIPKQMSRIELFEGFRWLHENHRNWDNFAARVKGMLKGIKRVPKVPQKGAPDPAKAALFRRFIMAMEDNARRAVLDIMDTVEKQAPYMREKIASMIIHQAGLYRALPYLIKGLENRIEIESQPGFVPEIIRTLPTIPNAFRPAHRKLFPGTFQNIYNGLEDKSLATECLIRVWKDFLIRWAVTFEQVEDFHLEHLRELCDRYLDQANSGQIQNTHVAADVLELDDVAIRRLGEEILVSVEQDLRGVFMPPAPAASAPVSLTVGASAN